MYSGFAPTPYPTRNTAINPAHLHAADLLGLIRLASTGTTGLSDVVETIHRDVLHAPWPGRGSSTRRTRGITGFVYRNVRGITWLAGSAADLALALIAPLFRTRSSSPERDAFLAALNGVIGDHLAATRNPLAVPMEFRVEARALTPASVETASRRVVVLIHGLCRDDRHWRRKGHDHGAALARDLGLTPVYLRYNTGLHVSINGRALAGQLEALRALWPAPIEELVIVAHSMGGLVARSACHYGALAGHGWLPLLRSMVLLGTPHHGAPAELAGNRFETLLESVPYAAALGRVGKLRSAGITDLRHGYVVDEHWQARERFAHGPDERTPVPLPSHVDCHVIAAARGSDGGRAGIAPGDGLVTVASALGDHDDPALDLALPASKRWIAWESSHFDLLSSVAVYEQIRRRLER